MQDYLSNHDFQVDIQVVEGNRKNIYASHGHGDKAILFYGHLDTVSLTSRPDWQTDPFNLTEVEGKLYGLGAYDMKGGISAFVEACASSSTYSKILLAVDEENWSAGIWKVLSERPDFFDDVEMIISAEPSFGLGLNGVTNARTSRYLYSLIFDGKPAHVAKYEEGIDAIKILGNFITDFHESREILFHRSGSFAQVRSVDASAIGMSVCGIARAEVEVLAAGGESLESVQEKIQSLTTATIKPKDRPTPYLPGYNFPTFPYQNLIGDIIHHSTGLDMELKTRKSVADDNALATLGIPVITWGPDGGSAHAANEFVDRDSLSTLAHMYRELLNTRANI